MQFFNMLMLGGLAAVAIPIIIQILTRKNVRRISWGAWLFLDKTMKKRRRKVLLEDLLLLACRCLALALLALAFARPFIDPASSVPWGVTLPLLLLAICCSGASMALWRYPRLKKAMLYGGGVLFALVIASVVFERYLNLKRLGKDADRDVVLLLDASASMSLVNDEAGKTNFELALEEARKCVQQSPGGTSFSVVLGGPVPQVLNDVPVSDRKIVMDTLDSVEKRYADGSLRGTMQIAGSLTAAGVVLQAGHSPVKQVVVFGDGQAEGWHLDDEGSDRWAAISRSFSTLQIAPQVVWRTLEMPKDICNLAVTSIRPMTEVVGRGSKVTFEVTVRNAGGEPVTPSDVTFTAGGRTYSLKEKGTKRRGDDAALATLAAGQSQVFRFTHTFAESGATTVSAVVETDGKDCIPSDDRCEFSMPVLESVRVLLIDGQGRGVAGRGASTFYLKAALRPELAALSAGAKPPDYLIETVLDDVPGAEARTYFTDFAAVVLSDVRQMSDKTMALLAEFVHGGGGLFVLPGLGTDEACFGRWAFEGQKVLPAPVGPFRPNKAALDPSAFGGMLQRFRTGTDLGSVVPERRMAFGEGWEPGTEVVAKLDDGSPFVLARSFGGGLVVETAAPFDISSGLVTKRGFLPMVHEIAYALARPIAVGLDIPPAEKLTLFLGKVPKRTGLLGAYYSSRDAKEATAYRVDDRISFDWGKGSPAAGIPADDFKVEWRGRLKPPETGKYKFILDGRGDRFSLSIGGNNVGNWSDITLDASKTYLVKLVFEEEKDDAFVQLRWRRPGKRDRDETVPASVFTAEVAGPVDAGELVQVTGPHDLPIKGEIYQDGINLFLHIARSLVPGRYVTELRPEQDGIRPWISGALDPEGGRIIFSVSANDDESRLEIATAEELQAVAGRHGLQMKMADCLDDVVKALNGESFGKEIWRTLAWIAFLLLVLEPAVSRWIAVNRRTGDIIDTEGSWIKT